MKTAEGDYGVNIPFVDGLVVLRADNSSGKSTVVQSIIYALGLEGMLSASHDVPLPHVMTDTIETEDRRELAVLESDVSLEIENAIGTRATVFRIVKGKRNRNLISVSDAIGNPPADYYVRQPGAATRTAGFHHWFATFIGWKLPEVARFDGSEGPLYVECMFPLMIVEQKRAWAGIQARMPLHYKIRDIAKRAIEFLLNLDVYDLALKRQRLKEEAATLKSEWRLAVGKADGLARSVDGVLRGYSPEPQPVWPPQIAGSIIVSRNDKWLLLSEAKKQDRAALTSLETKEIPRVRQISEETTQNLQDAQTELAEGDFLASRLLEEVQIEKAQLDGVERRIGVLDEDLRRNRDVRRLQAMGSVERLDLADGVCPTCHQAVADSLLPTDTHQQPMTVDDNIAFIESQLETFRAVSLASSKSLAAKERRLASARRNMEELRSRIRSLKETLVAEGSEPSVAAIEERLRLRDRIRQAVRVEDEMGTVSEQLAELSERWRAYLKEAASLPKGDLSASDEGKLANLQALFIAQARQFGVTSLRPESLSISRENYKPIHGGFELEFDLSASDMIRTIWAYLQSLLELSRSERTNHLGLLILDEPRQQETARTSLGQFLRRASDAGKFKEQIIIATSEEESTLLPHLRGILHTYRKFSGKILKRVV